MTFAQFCRLFDSLMAFRDGTEASGHRHNSNLPLPGKPAALIHNEIEKIQRTFMWEVALNLTHRLGCLSDGTSVEPNKALISDTAHSSLPAARFLRFMNATAQKDILCTMSYVDMFNERGFSCRALPASIFWYRWCI
jgi:hypothetical protein